MSTTVHPIVRRTVSSTLLRSLSAAAALLALQLIPAPGVLGSTTSAPEQEVSRAERLVVRHDCWTGAAPEGVEPTHAVISRPGGTARRVAARVGFGIWLDGDPGLIHGFCP